MKKKTLLTAFLTLAMSVSALSLTGCNNSYDMTETDALIAQLQTTMDSNKADLMAQIAALEQGYKNKDAELQASIHANSAALATLRTEYENAVAQLGKADEENAKALADLDKK